MELTRKITIELKYSNFHSIRILLVPINRDNYCKTVATVNTALVLPEFKLCKTNIIIPAIQHRLHKTLYLF